MAALVAADRLLLAHRHPQRRWYPDCWDLIGGHVEPDETPEDALVRECREEIAVHVCESRRVDLELDDPHLRAHAFLVTRWAGQPVNAAPEEHDALGWFRIDDLTGLRLAHPAYAEWLPTLIAEARTAR